MENPIKMDDLGGIYPYFRKHPCHELPIGTHGFLHLLGVPLPETSSQSRPWKQAWKSPQKEAG